MKPAIAFLFLASLSASEVTYTPTALDKKQAVMWKVVGCLDAAAPKSLELNAGNMYQALSTHGYHFLTMAESTDVMNTVQAKSFWARVVQYGGWAMAGGAAVMQFKIVAAKPQIVNGLTIGGGFLNTILPLAEKKVPGPPSWIGLLVHDQEIVRLSPGDCQTRVVLGQYEGAQSFTVQIPVP